MDLSRYAPRACACAGGFALARGPRHRARRGRAPPLRASLRTLTSAPLPLPCASRRSLARPRPSRGGRRRASLAAPPDRTHEFPRSLASEALSVWQWGCGDGARTEEGAAGRSPPPIPCAPPLLRPPSVRPLLRASPTPLPCGIFPLGPPARGTVASRVLVLTAFSAARRAGAPTGRQSPGELARALAPRPRPFHATSPVLLRGLQHPTSPPARTLRRARLLGKC